MKKFVYFILVGCLSFLTLWLAAEWCVGKIDTDYTHKYQQVYNNSSITTLLTGASLFENGINPHLLQDNDSIYDFATAGRWIYWDVLLAEKLFPTMPNLRVVLFPIAYDVMYYSLHYMPCRPEDEVSIYEYSKYMKVYYDRTPQKYTCRSALYMNQMGLRLWKNHLFDSLGYLPLEAKSPKWEISPIQDVFVGEMHQQCYREYQNYLMQLACICHKNNIRLITVTPPCADFYVEQTQHECIQNLYALIDSVKTYYPIEYRNYIDDTDFRADSLYYNANHLNSTGADMFAKRVKADFNL